MRLSGKEMEVKIMETNYIDTQLVDLIYDMKQQLVTIKYQANGQNEKEHAIEFKSCFSANFNIWLEDMKGSIPQSPDELAYFFHNITIEDIEINGVLLYQCKMIIPMMDCQIKCKSIQIL
ncbi:hypothetical protein [Planococcus maritimus]|uniref:hypothetical protein n=1 Tax=Planococcus maritimus TaxID=192421 RepID=UPI000794D1C3|nr:hypothetical protein [Planococcus maritimus]KYG70960.1 hypothetical protein AY633_15525 [Planococcus maritimus]